MITIPCSFGELVDKITILDIKLKEINDPVKLKNVRFEYDLLTQTPEFQNHIELYQDSYQELYNINLAIWYGENNIRQYEQNQDFGTEFISIARLIRENNDQRSRIKKQLNKDFGSEIIEEKSHREI
jgi:hypothetical protein